MRKEMQIQLNQNEIEIALRNYVNGILQIQEGMTINITLKATRGDDGQTAIIDIVPKVEEKVAPAPAATSTVAVQRRPRAAQVVTNETKAAQPESQGVSGSVGQAADASTAKEETGNASAAAEADNSTSSDAAATTGDAPDASQAGDEKPATERKSLFAGLSRPVNS